MFISFIFFFWLGGWRWLFQWSNDLKRKQHQTTTTTTTTMGSGIPKILKSGQSSPQCPLFWPILCPYSEVWHISGWTTVWYSTCATILQHVWFGLAWDFRPKKMRHGQMLHPSRPRIVLGPTSSGIKLSCSTTSAACRLRGCCLNTTKVVFSHLCLTIVRPRGFKLSKGSPANQHCLATEGETTTNITA